ncbi:MAG TPA: hypothetical protein VKR62_12880 [Roseiarcus sp.]|nr:hypothetical protein [Roseiarcus sp.]
MAEVKKAQLADLQKQVAAKLDRVRVTEFGDAPKYQALANAINTLAVDSYIGNVAFIGRDSSGGYSVQFNTGNTGYSSAWPEWAFEMAKTSLITGKQLWVIANGAPFGFDLLNVMVLA